MLAQTGDAAFSLGQRHRKPGGKFTAPGVMVRPRSSSLWSGSFCAPELGMEGFGSVEVGGMLCNFFLVKIAIKCTFLESGVGELQSSGLVVECSCLSQATAPPLTCCFRPGPPVSCTICTGNKVHLRLCLPYLGATSCLLCWESLGRLTGGSVLGNFLCSGSQGESGACTRC